MKNPNNYQGTVKIVWSQYVTGVPKVGGFGAVKEAGIPTRINEWEVNKWVYCRDLFHRKSKNIKKFLFVQGKVSGMNVIAFIDKVETVLNIKKRTSMGLTQRNNIIWVEPAGWWTRFSMRNSLFTILLRSGRNYKRSKDNFQDALFSNEYAKDTKFAVERFFDGFTRYQGRVSGWHNQFCLLNPTEDMTKELLVKP